VVVSDDPALAAPGADFALVTLPGSTTLASTAQNTAQKTEWVLFTSGTTGVPKMVAHTLAGLTGAIQPATQSDNCLGHFL